MSIVEELTRIVRATITKNCRPILDRSGFNSSPNRDRFRELMKHVRSPLFQMGFDDFVPSDMNGSPPFVGKLRTAFRPSVDAGRDECKFFEVNLVVLDSSVVAQWSEDQWLDFVVDGYIELVQKMEHGVEPLPE